MAAAERPQYDRGVIPAINTSIAFLADTLQAERPRWFLWCPVFLGLGIASYFSLAEEPSALTVAAFALIAITMRLIWRGGFAGPLIASACLAMAAGLALAKLRTEWTAAPVIERTMHRAQVRGIVELVEPKPGSRRGERITLKLTSIEGVATAKLPQRARIRTMVTTPGLQPGDAIRLTAKIGPPSPPSLPGDYDFARAAWFQRLGATGYALSKAEIERPRGENLTTPSVAARWAVFLEHLRQRIGNRVADALPGERGAIATALITGSRGGITEETNAAFRDSGLFHILSISGLHMVVMAGAAFLGVRRLLALVPSIALYYPVKKWAAVAALLAAFAYLNISGSAVATVRSAVMIAIIFFAVLIDRPALAMRNVALAALLILCVMPESLLDAGFQMSFAAVVALVAVYEVLRSRAEANEVRPISAFGTAARFFGGIVLSTLIASFSVAPLAAYHFHKTQQFAVLANLLAIPVCNIIVMPAGLLTMLAMPAGLEAAPLWIMGLGIDIMVWAAQTVAAMPGAVGHIPAISHTTLMFMVVGGLWLTLWQTRWRLAGLVIAAAGILVGPFQPRADILVGRGGALVAVRTGDGRLAAVPGRTAGFELQRWLENDGDARSVAEASAPGVWRCDPSGCTATIKGVTIAAARHASAIPDDCARARVLILPFARPEGCSGPEIVLEPRAFWEGGTHVIAIEPIAIAQRAGAQSAAMPRIRIDTVSAQRGQRPWTVAMKLRDAGSKQAQSPITGQGAAREPTRRASGRATRGASGVPARDADDD